MIPFDFNLYLEPGIPYLLVAKQLQWFLHGREQLGRFCKAPAQGMEGSLLQLPRPRQLRCVQWMPSSTSKQGWHHEDIKLFALRWSNMAMENGPFVGDLPIKTSMNRGCPIAVFDYQKVHPTQLYQPHQAAICRSVATSLAHKFCWIATWHTATG